MTFPSNLRYCLSITVCLLTPMLFAAQDHKPAYVSFEVPDSVATYPLSINDKMTITGYYVSKSGLTHGFVRDEDGVITTFDVPGSSSTSPVSINYAGEITGTYLTSSASPMPGIPQGFIRSPEGKITLFGDTISPYGSGSRPFDANPVKVNVDGEVVGNFPYPNAAPSVFIRSRSGVLQAFSLSDGAEYPTVATGLNASGEVLGYASSEGIIYAQGFLWSGQGPVPSPFSGTTTLISVPGSMGTFPTGINGGGVIVGCYSINTSPMFAPPALTYFDFWREPDGTITTLSVPATVPSCLANVDELTGVTIVSPATIVINHEDTIVGTYMNTANMPAGFIQKKDGKLITFTYPNASMTMPAAVNNRNIVTGYFAHETKIKGFLRLPDGHEK
jgi:hypothetical protein